MSKDLLIGSVVEIAEIGELLIVGTRLESMDGIVRPLYVAVPYPLGFFDINSVIKFDINKIKKILFERKDTDILTVKWNNGYGNLISVLEGKTEEECQEILHIDSINE